jgi:hypothetical protein
MREEIEEEEGGEMEEEERGNGGRGKELFVDCNCLASLCRASSLNQLQIQVNACAARPTAACVGSVRSRE